MIFQHLKHQPRQCEHWWSPWIKEKNMKITKWIIFLVFVSLSLLSKNLGSRVVGDSSHHCTNTAQQQCVNTAHHHWFPPPQKMAPDDLHFTWGSILRLFHLAHCSEIIHRPHSSYHRRYKFCFEPNQAAARKSPVALPNNCFYWFLWAVASTAISVKGIVCVISSIVLFSNHKACLESGRASRQWRLIRRWSYIN